MSKYYGVSLGQLLGDIKNTDNIEILISKKNGCSIGLKDKNVFFTWVDFMKIQKVDEEKYDINLLKELSEIGLMMLINEDRAIYDIKDELFSLKHKTYGMGLGCSNDNVAYISVLDNRVEVSENAYMAWIMLTMHDSIEVAYKQILSHYTNDLEDLNKEVISSFIDGILELLMKGLLVLY